MINFKIENGDILITDDSNTLCNISYSVSYTAYMNSTIEPTLDKLLDYRISISNKLKIEDDTLTQLWYKREICAIDFILYMMYYT